MVTSGNTFSKSVRMLAMVILDAYVVAILSPKTVIARPVEWGWQGMIRFVSSSLGTQAPQILFWIGYLFAALAGVWYFFRYRTVYKRVSPVRRTIDSVGLLIGVYLLDPWVSTVSNYSWTAISWVFPISILFFLILVLRDDKIVQHLLKVISVAIIIECIYAIVYHLIGIHQFYTPRFGLRTRGTLGNPIYLGVLVMAGLPILLNQAMLTKTNPQRTLWWLGVAVALLASWLTYVRSVWLGIAALFLNYALAFRDTRTRKVSWGMISVTLLLILCILLLRPPFVPQDRSGRGRLAIWEVALSRIVPLHPIIGAGAGSYYDLQSKYLTSRLAQFNPSNAEPKNLYLLLLIEHGVVGLALFSMLVLRIIQLAYSLSKATDCTQCQTVSLLLKGTTASLLTAGLFETPMLYQGREASSFVFFTVIACGCVIALTNFESEKEGRGSS